MESHELKRLIELEAENARQKKMYADLSLDHTMLKDVLPKVLKPCKKKERAEHLIREYIVSIGRACKVVELARSMFNYRPKKDDTEVISKLETMVKELPTTGFDEYFGRIRNEGYKVEPQAPSESCNGAIDRSPGFNAPVMSTVKAV